MNVRIRHNRLSHAPGPIDRRAVEVIHLRCVERIQFNRIEQIGMALEKIAEAAAGRIVGMRGNHETRRLGSPKPGHVLEAGDAFRCGIEIQQ